MHGRANQASTIYWIVTTPDPKGSPRQQPSNKPQRQSMQRYRDYNLERAVIITEDEHDDGYTMETENDVVFVLPNKSRVTPEQIFLIRLSC